MFGGGRNVVHVKYEDLRFDTISELERIVYELSNKNIDGNEALRIVDQFSFEKQSGRKPGQESTSSFMRKGIVGDWKNYFTLEAKKKFDYYAGDALIGLGYEKDHSWVFK
jgi:hypothetical protein